MSTDGSGGADDADSPQPKTRYGWFLAVFSATIAAVIFLIAPAAGWDLHGNADYLGYLALLTLFGAAEVERRRLTGA